MMGCLQKSCGYINGEPDGAHPPDSTQGVSRCDCLSQSNDMKFKVFYIKGLLAHDSHIIHDIKTVVLTCRNAATFLESMT